MVISSADGGVTGGFGGTTGGFDGLPALDVSGLFTVLGHAVNVNTQINNIAVNTAIAFTLKTLFIKSSVGFYFTKKR
ncbi:hypothetical protein [Treponema lecithinolyticum]|uniref:hypothetical protein n=1 Tax=Treponema lecithinolyticum TaxID=53418 RepID=UPI003607A235